MDAIRLHGALWQRLWSGRDRLPHALLLAGPSGNFKTEFARGLAASLLCESPEDDGRACGRCLACNWLAQGNHPDFRSLRPEALEDAPVTTEGAKSAKEAKGGREITIDQVRALAEFLNVGTHRAGYRVVLVAPADAMNRNTANALLKSLEEPKEGTVFILVSDHPDRLLPTIRSRCRVEALASPDVDVALTLLHEAKLPDAERWLSLSGGVPGLALTMANGPLRRLGQLLDDQLSRGGQLDFIRISSELDALLRSERDLTPYEVVDWVQRWAFDLTRVIVGLPPRYHGHSGETLHRLAQKTSFEALSAFWRRSVECKRLAHHPLNARLYFEDMFSDYVAVFTARST